MKLKVGNDVVFGAVKLKMGKGVGVGAIILIGGNVGIVFVSCGEDVGGYKGIVCIVGDRDG